MAKWVYRFSEGNASMRPLLGGKGANLAEMTGLGMPIPQGFTVTTEACTEYYRHGKQITDEIQAQIFEAIGWLEEYNGKKFGDTQDPLLVSVRSGARASMPGMMDTILNLGLNDVAVEGFAVKTGNPRFAYDSYRRFIQMFSDVVMEVPKSYFEKIIDEVKADKGVVYDTELTADDLKELIVRFKAVYKEAMKGEEFPQDPKVQLMEAVKAVFRSWDNPRAIVYRRMNDIPGDWGTAVNVQTMVFGNKGDTSGTGVAFTRNPSTGAKGIYGEYLINAQGEDVVAGVRTPQPITQLEKDLPECYSQFMELAMKLENHYKDMQDMEFTIEEGKLYFLQTRNGKRTAQAAIQIACDLVDEGMITPREAVMRIEAKSLDQLLHPMFDTDALKAGEVIGEALPASPGAAAGKVVFTAEEAQEYSTAYTKDAFAVMKAFGLNSRKPAVPEQKIMEKWFKDYGFDRELVLEACSRTINAIHTPSFQYADSILTDWKKAGVKTLADVKGMDARRAERAQNGAVKRLQSYGNGAAAQNNRKTSQNQFHNFKQRDTDYDALMLQNVKEWMDSPE